MADARASAQVLAAASNLALGRITAVVEGGGAPQPVPFAAEKAMDAGSTPVEPGTVVDGGRHGHVLGLVALQRPASQGQTPGYGRNGCLPSSAPALG